MSSSSSSSSSSAAAAAHPLAHAQWPAFEAEAGAAEATELLRFLRVNALAPAAEVPLSPPPRVDAAWHRMVLYTSLYRDTCASVGRFVDHIGTNCAACAGQHETT